MLQPSSVEDLAQLIADAATPLDLRGTGSKPLGNPVNATPVSLKAFDGVIAYEPEELILDVKAATPMAEINRLLAARKQMLAFEPPDYSSLLGTTSAGSIGGVVACALSGPRRVKAGAVRDHMLGVTGVTGQGLVFKAGARVVKNVTGFDMPKLLTGSHGTLAAMTSLIVKVLPAAEMEESLLIRNLAVAEAVTVMSEALQSSADVSAAAHVPGQGTCLRLEGIAPSVAFRRDRLMKALGHDAGLLTADESRAFWRGVRDVKPFWGMKEQAIWRASVTPSLAPQILATLHQGLDLHYMIDWAGGLLWLAVQDAPDGGAAIIRSAVQPGHATLIRAPDAIWEKINAFQPQSPALAALSQRVKQAFDPRGILAPGRMYREA